MAYVLSLRPQSPLKRSFSDDPYLQSHADVAVSTLCDITTRNASTYSICSLESARHAQWLRCTENTPSPHASRSQLNLVPEEALRSSPVDDAPRKRSCGSNRPPPSFTRFDTSSTSLARKFKDARPVVESMDHEPSSPEPMVADNTDEDNDETEFFGLYSEINLQLPEVCWSDDIKSESHGNRFEALPNMDASPQPFRRWMSTLKRRHIQRRKNNTSDVSIDPESSLMAPLVPTTDPIRRPSGSISSSMGCVTAMKSASITIASASIAPRSDVSAFPGKLRLGNRSSYYSEARKSTDSHGGGLGTVMDEGAWIRSVSRRKVVEELISSEESYIADLKVLINDYFMILTAVPTISAEMRTSIQKNIAQILQLHEDLLAELHHVVPQADLTQSAQQETYPVSRAKHVRFHSADFLPGRLSEHKITRRLRHSLDMGRTPDRRPQGLIIETKTIGDIAKIFNKHMKRFFSYEEYGAHWTTMSKDLTSTCKNLHGWQEYERGVEALSKVVASENNRQNSSRKALSFSDLLIKPIQRVCKYPLLFDDLCRHTPVYDDPEAHAELEKALFRLQETIREVNKAKDDPKTRRLIEITWQLQDRLMFQEQTFSRALVFRLLGHVLLCGVLHVTYQTTERPKGQYMVCVLYKSCLVLATAGRFSSPYTVVASIPLANGTIEDTNNGRGLQCHTAPHTWKLVFQNGHRLNEIILSACSSQEEEVWLKHLRQRIVCETRDFVDGQSTMQDMFSSLHLDIKSIGPVFGHADSLVRRMSVHRAATLGSKQNVNQVIIKNTQAQKTPDPPPPFAPAGVTRSQSHMSANHIPTLAPRRAERFRLEAALEDVWTKDVLPFPGFGNRRMENQIRASANSVMRKLSMASIASNFSRRSPSFSSVGNTRSEDSFGSKAPKISQGNPGGPTEADRRPAPAVVDFHNAPAAFLPTDFELQDVRPPSRRRRLAHRAAGNERWSEKNTPATIKRARRVSSHVTMPRTESRSRIERSEASAASDMTILRPIENVLGKSKGQENEKLKTREVTHRHSSRRDEASPPLAKKFLKSKSRIFKFWV